MTNSIDPFFVAVIGAVAGYGGAILQASAAKNFERERFGRQARYDAYGLYLKSVGQLSFAKNDDERAIAHSLIAEARGKIALYGSPDVVSSMAQAFRRGADLHSEAARPDHAAMICSMRADVDPRSRPADNAHLFELLYGSIPTGEKT